MRDYLRKKVVDPQEEYLISFGHVFFNSEACFTGFQGNPLSTFPLIQVEENRGIGLDNIYIRHGAHRFGWIEDIELNFISRSASIGHIATKRELMGIGLGKALCMVSRGGFKNLAI